MKFPPAANLANVLNTLAPATVSSPSEPAQPSASARFQDTLKQQTQSGGADSGAVHGDIPGVGVEAFFVRMIFLSGDYRYGNFVDILQPLLTSSFVHNCSPHLGLIVKLWV